MAEERSEAFVDFIAKVNELTADFKAGKIGGIEAKRGIIAFLNKLMGYMHVDELEAIQSMLHSEIFEIADRLAQAGFPVPGNDPKRPN